MENNVFNRKLDYGLELTRMVQSLQKYLDYYNIKSMVLGLSGGLDSTLVAAIASLVKGHDLIGLSLPSLTNKDSEQILAKDCLDAFCSTKILHPIHSEFDSIRRGFYGLSSIPQTYVGLGNLKARIRMMALYHVAGLEGGIVLDTDNLTEHYLGFFTINGDVGDVNPIGKYWKSELYELASYMASRNDLFNEMQIGCLQRAIDAIPTDGNGVQDGGDMAQIAPGCTYKQVDKVLKEIVKAHEHEGLVGNELANRIHSKHNDVSLENIEKIMVRFLQSLHKREKRPIVL